ncbi:helix-turn-helix domain-containing protein [Clostridium perfringens]|jgi:DNA-binding XRE family transcriptional regulator
MALKKYRMKMGMTQEQLARLLGITLRTYQNIEKRNDTTVKIAKNLAVILGGTIEEIFEEECK